MKVTKKFICWPYWQKIIIDSWRCLQIRQLKHWKLSLEAQRIAVDSCPLKKQWLNSQLDKDMDMNMQTVMELDEVHVHGTETQTQTRT
jgi:hypothetical protein